MTIGAMLRGLFGKRRGDTAPSRELTSVPPAAAQALTEQDLEQVQGGASGGGLPITSVPAYKIEGTRTIGNPNI